MFHQLPRYSSTKYASFTLKTGRTSAANPTALGAVGIDGAVKHSFDAGDVDGRTKLDADITGVGGT